MLWKPNVRRSRIEDAAVGVDFVRAPRLYPKHPGAANAVTPAWGEGQQLAQGHHSIQCEKTSVVQARIVYCNAARWLSINVIRTVWHPSEIPAAIIARNTVNASALITWSSSRNKTGPVYEGGNKSSHTRSLMRPQQMTDTHPETKPLHIV